MDDHAAKRIAKNDRRFFAHEADERRQGYVIFEKIGRAAEVVRDLDPRSEHR